MLLDWIFTTRCACCQNTINHHLSLCEYCLANFPFFCPKQYNLLHRPDINRVISLKYCDGLFACGWYHGWLQHWLSEYKFHKRTHIKRLLTQLINYQMLRFWQHGGFSPDLCFFIPLSPTRFVKRGYNQVSQTWSPILEKHSNVSEALVRVRATKAQSKLSKAQRKRNVKDAFALSHSIEGKNIAIIDDVITTGSTMDAAAQACLRAGAAKVWAFSTSLTPLLGK
ncbi:ComF family protein [Pseudoalteromonas sp. S16_S37]|uniref:ComF family protein n=1 Tax=Pseudoalteromonas sp. S16_S37 TaxID=2720228 RepID=UPI0016814A90|nr:ComF family protein [Pseudoalteromonas sp. S16_S37]MBD1582006.1 ComF family protein [Pseudoalteromonas sp. S16_S37]